MSQARPRKRNFSEWLMTYRKIIILVLFFILVPIVLVTAIYTGNKANGTKVYFNSESNEFIRTKKFIDIEKFDVFDLDVDYTKRSSLFNDDEENPEQIGHIYSFSFKYDKNIQDVSKISVKPVLLAPWSTYQVQKDALSLNESTSRTLTIEFEKISPYQPLWFVNVSNPIMYLEVKYTTSNLEHIEYISFDLATDTSVIID